MTENRYFHYAKNNNTLLFHLAWGHKTELHGTMTAAQVSRRYFRFPRVAISSLTHT
jgi:hypothetical protein